MSHGIIHTRKHGLVHGLKHFTHPLSGPTSWSVDATANKALPQNNGEWAALLTAAGGGLANPNSIYLCQDLNTQLTDVNGGFHLAPVGAGHVYAQPVTGWAAKAAYLADGTTGSWATTDAALPDCATTSTLACAVFAMPAVLPANTRNMLCHGTTTNIAAARINITTGFQSALSIGAAGTGVNNVVNTVRLVWLRLNRTTSEVRVLTDLEIIPAPAFQTGMTGKSFRIGAPGAASSSGCIYAARWDGAPSEAFDNTVIKAVSQTMGWTIPW